MCEKGRRLMLRGEWSYFGIIWGQILCLLRLFLALWILRRREVKVYVAETLMMISGNEDAWTCVFGVFLCFIAFLNFVFGSPKLRRLKV